MRKMLFALTVVALALAASDPAMAQRPCDPYCDERISTADADPGEAASLAPVFLAMTAFVVASRAVRGDDRAG